MDMKQALVVTAVASAVAAVFSLITGFWSAKSSHDAAKAAERTLETARLQWTSQITVRWHDYAHAVDGEQSVVIDFYNEGASAAFGLKAETSVPATFRANPVEFNELSLGPGEHVSRVVKARQLPPPLPSFLGRASVSEPLYRVNVTYRDLRGKHYASFIFSFEDYSFYLLRAFEDGTRHVQDPDPISRKVATLPPNLIEGILGIDDIK